MANWTSMKFSTIFKLMVDFAEALPEPEAIRNIFDKTEIVTLISWRDNALRFVDQDLLQRVFPFQRDMQKVAHEKVDIRAFETLKNTLEISLQKIQQNQEILEAEQVHLKETVNSNSDKIRKLEILTKKGHLHYSASLIGTQA
jgi:hypothetical protein